MNKCCWNRDQGLVNHNNDCLPTYGPQYRNATLAVTYMDGQTIIYKNVRVCINRPDADGITVDGTTVRFETMDVCFTVVGVRQYVYEIDDDL